MVLLLWGWPLFVLAIPVDQISSAKGYWFFNREPARQVIPNASQSQTKSSISRLKSKEIDSVSLRKKELSDRIQYYAYNHLGGPVQLHLDFLRQDNISSNIKLPADVILPPLEEKKVLEIQPRSPFSGWSFRLNYQYIPGDPNANVNPRQYYLLPFPQSQRFFVSQGFNGRFSHYSEASRYAVDISMPEGTPIHSVSQGVVMDIDENFDSGGVRQQLMDQANVLRILHQDGTMAVYAHLQSDSVKVKIGEKVQAGQVIALSGNTGFSTGPHLHFAIEKNVNMKLKSIPFKFLINGKWQTPTRGQLLKH